MNLQYNYDENQQELVYYTLGYLIFISTFFIALKALTISIILPLILFIVLTLVSGIYILNINKYSLFRYDIFIFLTMYYTFGAYLSLKILTSLWTANIGALGQVLIYSLMIISIFNSIIIICKSSRMKGFEAAKVFFILLSYCYITLFIITSFGWVYINKSNISISNYISNTFTYDDSKGKYNYNNKEAVMGDFLSYDEKRFKNVFIQFGYDETGLRKYIDMKFSPVNRLEDYVMFSVENYFSGDLGGIKAEGTEIKNLMIAEKFLFALMSLVVLVSLVGLYKLREK